jgi:pimeloyl-ACP methyl ester carboxylesterase
VFFSGLEGAPLAAGQVDHLTDEYRVTSVSHAVGDTSSWDELARDAAAVVADEGPGVVLVGESFGAALALRVAALQRNSSALERLVLINSGTALREDNVLNFLTRLLPLLKADGSGLVLYRAAALVLYNGLLVASSSRLDDRSVSSGIEWRSVDIDAVPLDTMLHRVSLLREFSETFGDDCIRRLVSAPTVLVASARDRLLRSVREAERLERLLPNVESKIVLAESAHACLLETDVSLKVLVNADVSRLPGSNGSKATAGSRDAGRDSMSYAEARELGSKVLTPLRLLTSPVFTGRDNVTEAMRRSAESEQPVLFVGNHGVRFSLPN